MRSLGCPYRRKGLGHGHTAERAGEDTQRRQPPASQGDRPSEDTNLGASLVIQEVATCLPMPRVQVRFLVRELGSHIPWGS